MLRKISTFILGAERPVLEMLHSVSCDCLFVKCFIFIYIYFLLENENPIQVYTFYCNVEISEYMVFPIRQDQVSDELK